MVAAQQSCIGRIIDPSLHHHFFWFNVTNPPTVHPQHERCTIPNQERQTNIELEQKGQKT